MLDSKKSSHVKRVFNEESLYNKEAPYKDFNTQKNSQKLIKLPSTVDVGALQYTEKDFKADFIMEQQLPDIARRHSIEEVSELLRLTKISGQKRNNLPLYKSQQYSPVKAPATQETPQPPLSSSSKFKTRMESQVSIVNHKKSRQLLNASNQSDVIRLEASQHAEYEVGQQSMIAENYATTQSNRRRVDQLLLMLQSKIEDDDVNIDSAPQHKQSKRQQSEVPASQDSAKEILTNKLRASQLDQNDIVDLMSQRPSRQDRSKFSLEQIDRIGAGRHQVDYLKHLNSKSKLGSKLGKPSRPKLSNDDQIFLDSFVNESNNISDAGSVLTYKVRKPLEPARLTNLSYVMKNGSVKPTASYIRRSPFIKNNGQTLRAGSQTVQKTTNSEAPLTQLARQNSMESMDSMLPPISQIRAAVGNSTALEKIEDDESDDSVADVQGLMDTHGSLLQKLEQQVRLFEQYTKVASMAGATDAGHEILKALQSQALSTQESYPKEFISIKGTVQESTKSFGNRRLSQTTDMTGHTDVLDRQSVMNQRGSRPSIDFITRIDSVQNIQARPLDMIVEYNEDMSVVAKQSSIVSLIKKLPASTNPSTIWLKKVKKLYQLLEENNNREVTEIMNQSQDKKFKLSQLIYETQFENDILKARQKQLVTATSTKIRTLKSDQQQLGPQHTQEQSLLKQIQDQIVRRDELSQWMFHSFVISYRIKVRMMEDVIERVQKMQNMQKNGENYYQTVLEVQKFVKARDQTFDDLNTYMTQRESSRWVNWDQQKKNWRQFSWFRIVPPRPRKILNDKLHDENDDFLKQKKVLDKVQKDFDFMIQTGDSLVEWLSKQQGGYGWLQLFNLRKLRQAQALKQEKNKKVSPLQIVIESTPEPSLKRDSTVTLQVKQPLASIVPTKAKSMAITPKEGIVDPQILEAAGSSLNTQPTVETTKQSGSKWLSIIQKEKSEKPAQKLTFAPLINEPETPKNQEEETSKWLMALHKETTQKGKKDARNDPTRAARMARLAHLFEDSDEEAEQEDTGDKQDDRMDQLAAQENLSKFLQKVDHHLDIEKVLIDEWSHQPQQQQSLQTLKKQKSKK